MNKSQNYNTNKIFKDKLGIEEYKKLNFTTGSGGDIVKNVEDGNESYYKVGSIETIDMGTYGTHILHIANTSTPSECNTAGFS